MPPAIEPLERMALLASLVRGPDESTAEALRLAAELARTIDALIIEEVDPSRLADAVADAPELARHWEKALERFRAVLDRWPSLLAERGQIDLTDRRNRLLRRMAERWSEKPPAGFTVAAGITTAAPAIAAATLVRRESFTDHSLVRVNCAGSGEVVRALSSGCVRALSRIVSECRAGGT